MLGEARSIEGWLAVRRIRLAGLFDRDRELSAVGALLIMPCREPVGCSWWRARPESARPASSAPRVRWRGPVACGCWARGAASWSPGSPFGLVVRCSPNLCAPPTPDGYAALFGGAAALARPVLEPAIEQVFDETQRLVRDPARALLVCCRPVQWGADPARGRRRTLE